MLAYNQAVEPPAPFLDITVHHPEDDGRSLHILAKIDTAADLSVLPVEVIERLGLPVSQRLIIEGYDGVSTIMYAYATVIETAEARFNNVRVISYAEEYALIGRDILNHLYLCLNGPEQTFTVSTKPE